MVERNTQALHFLIPCIGQKCYTTYMLRYLLFKICVTNMQCNTVVMQCNTVVSNVVTMIMHIVRCTQGDLCTVGLVCD